MKENGSHSSKVWVVGAEDTLCTGEREREREKEKEREREDKTGEKAWGQRKAGV